MQFLHCLALLACLSSAAVAQVVCPERYTRAENDECYRELKNITGLVDLSSICEAGETPVLSDITEMDNASIALNVRWMWTDAEVRGKYYYFRSTNQQVTVKPPQNNDPIVYKDGHGPCIAYKRKGHKDSKFVKGDCEHSCPAICKKNKCPIGAFLDANGDCQRRSSPDFPQPEALNLCASIGEVLVNDFNKFIEAFNNGLGRYFWTDAAPDVNGSGVFRFNKGTGAIVRYPNPDQPGKYLTPKVTDPERQCVEFILPKAKGVPRFRVVRCSNLCPVLCESIPFAQPNFPTPGPRPDGLTGPPLDGPNVGGSQTSPGSTTGTTGSTGPAIPPTNPNTPPALVPGR